MCGRVGLAGCRNDPSLAAAEVALLADRAARNTGQSLF